MVLRGIINAGRGILMVLRFKGKDRHEDLGGKDRWYPNFAAVLASKKNLSPKTKMISVLNIPENPNLVTEAFVRLKALRHR